MIRTPPIRTKGIFSLQTPFEAAPDTIYVVHAVRSFQDLEERLIDPFATFYEPNGLTQQDYETDRQNKVTIVTLIDAEGGEVLYVPDSYILSFPDMGQVPYQRVVLSLDFGPLPEALDLTQVQTDIGNLAGGIIGKSADVTLHVAPTTDAITPAEHESLEASRQASQTINETVYAQFLEQKRIVESQKEIIATLEQILIDNGIITG